jgi:hypothetical protein
MGNTSRRGRSEQPRLPGEVSAGRRCVSSGAGVLGFDTRSGQFAVIRRERFRARIEM